MLCLLQTGIKTPNVGHRLLLPQHLRSTPARNATSRDALFSGYKKPVARPTARIPCRRPGHRLLFSCVLLLVGGVLLSHTLPSAVPSAQVGLASGFEMGPGVSLPLSTTDTPIRTTPPPQPFRTGRPACVCPGQPSPLGVVSCQTLHSRRELCFSYRCVCAAKRSHRVCVSR